MLLLQAIQSIFNCWQTQITKFSMIAYRENAKIFTLKIDSVLMKLPNAIYIIRLYFGNRPAATYVSLMSLNISSKNFRSTWNFRKFIRRIVYLSLTILILYTWQHLHSSVLLLSHSISNWKCTLNTHFIVIWMENIVDASYQRFFE